MADDSTCVDGQCKSPSRVSDYCEENDSSNSSDYLYVTCSPRKSVEYSDHVASDNESDSERDAFAEDVNFYLSQSQSKASYQCEISEQLYRLKMENEILKEQLSQVIEIFDECCETDIPLVQVSFSTYALAMNYKSDIETYLCSLLTSDKGSDISDCEKESDNITSRSPVRDQNIESPKELFVLETSADNDIDDSFANIPIYDKEYEETLDNKPKEISKPARPVASCFNCLGNHRLNECPKKHDKNSIASNKKKYYNKQASRNIPLDTRRPRLFTAGVISKELRNALGLESNQLPLYIYHMRLLGYPPGWMKEAEIHDSELKMYDSEGKINYSGEDIENLQPDCGPSEVNYSGENNEIHKPEDGSSKARYDPSLLIDYPGFNVPTPLDYIDESAELGLPRIQFHQLRCVTELKMTPPGKMPYRKRKLPSTAEIQARRFKLGMDFLEDMETESLDMEIESLDNGEGRIIDSDDDDAQLCKFIPPLPPEQPNHVPSPPPLPIPLPNFSDMETVTTKEKDDALINAEAAVVKKEEDNSLNKKQNIIHKKTVIANKKTVKNEERNNEEAQDELSSTSLKDLEEQKQKLLSELRKLWAGTGNKDKKQNAGGCKCTDKYIRECHNTHRGCRDVGCRQYRELNFRKSKVKKLKKEKKQVPRLIVVGDSTCKKLCFEYKFTREDYQIEIFTGDHWKLQTAMDHLKTKDLTMEGNEILLVHLGINDFLLRQNGSLSEINNYAKRFIQQTRKKVKHLIISAILPSTFFSTTINCKIQCRNVFIRELCKNEGVSFLNARKAFMKNGILDKEFFQEDNFNLSSKGSEKLSSIFSSCFESAILRNTDEKCIKEENSEQSFVEWFE